MRTTNLIQEAEVVNTENGRYYRINQQLYPSVTTVLQSTESEENKARLERWRQQNPTLSTDAPANRGTRLHQAIADHLAGKPPTLDDEIEPFWHQASQLLPALANPRYCEQVIYHAEYGYAGTLDLVADWQGKPTVVDWKTSRRTKKLSWIENHQLQTAAYAKAFDSMQLDDQPIEQTLVVIFTPQQCQLFVFDQTEIEQHWQRWQERLQQFYASGKSCHAQKA